MIKIILKSFLIVYILLLLSSSIFAQSPPSPPAAPTIVPWGPIEIYLVIILGYVVKTLWSTKKQHK